MNQTNFYMKAALDAIKSTILLTSGAGVKVKLAQAPFAPNPDSVPGDFTEADFTGYAAAALTTTTGDTRVGNSWESTFNALASFASTGSTVGNTIVGYWIESNAGDLLGYDAFVPTIGMNAPGDAINLAVRWQVQPAVWPNTLLP